jgi:hypothetical protein
VSFIRCTTLVAMFVAAVAATARAQETATQTVTYSVSAISEIEVSGDPGALAVTSASGGTFTDATDASTTYNVSTNTTGAKITAAINTAMPAGLTLKVNLTAPTGGTSAGAITLGTTDVDAVTGITQVSESGKTIAYTLSAAPTAGAVSSATKTVTFTIVAGT